MAICLKFTLYSGSRCLPHCCGGQQWHPCHTMAFVFFRVASTIFTLAISRGPAVSGQSHSPCCRQAPRPAAALREEKQPAMVWQASLRPYLVADARKDAIAPDVPPEPQYSDLNLGANYPWITNSNGSLQYRPFPGGEKFQFQSFHLSRRDEKRPLFTWLPGWRLESDRGLFHSFRNQASVLAFAYSDIFETRANPDKGGHGPGILFRHDLGKRKKSRPPQYWKRVSDPVRKV